MKLKKSFLIPNRLQRVGSEKFNATIFTHQNKFLFPYNKYNDWQKFFSDLNKYKYP